LSNPFDRDRDEALFRLRNSAKWFMVTNDGDPDEDTWRVCVKAGNTHEDVTELFGQVAYALVRCVTDYAVRAEPPEDEE